MSTTVEAPKPAEPKKQRLNAYPFWSPRFWHGMRLGDFLRLLSRNRFRIHPLRWPMALILGPVTAYNSVLARAQRLFYERAIQETEITEPPIFILGHWRSGTTLLHELLICDERFAFPTTYECFAPCHFLVTGWFVPQTLWILLPSRRPQDNMSTGFDRPQEDEFALTALGAPTPYYRMAFPNHPTPYLETLDMHGVSDKDLEDFKRKLVWFMKALTLKKKKQLVLKSPPHTGRIALLAEMFPGAKFIHITRDPYEVFSSMQRLWQAMDSTQGFQFPKHEGMDEFILSTFDRMYRGFHRQREEIDAANICDVRYEDLAQNPIDVVEQIYERLNLGEFETARPRVEEYVATLKGYRPNRHELDEPTKSLIRQRWSEFVERYGY